MSDLEYRMSDLWVKPDIEDRVVGILRELLPVNGEPGIPVDTMKPRDVDPDAGPVPEFVRITLTGGNIVPRIQGFAPYDDGLVLLEVYAETEGRAVRLINLCRAILECELTSDYGEAGGVSNLPDPDEDRLRRYTVLTTVRAHAARAATA